MAETPTDLARELGGPEAPLRMTEVAGFVGNLRRLELALFAWLGRAAPAAGEPAVVAWASAASLRAAWRATQLEALLPVSSGLPVSRGLPDSSGLSDSSGPPVSTGLPSPAGTPLGPALQGALAALGEEPRTPTERALPEQARQWYAALEAAYRFRLAHLSPASDAQLERSLRRVLEDLHEEQAALEAGGELHGRNA